MTSFQDSQLFRKFYLPQYAHRMHQLQSQQNLASEGSHFQLIKAHVGNQYQFLNPVFSDLDDSTIGHKMKNI